MKKTSRQLKHPLFRACFFCLCAVGLAACGGGTDSLNSTSGDQQSAAPLASGTTTLQAGVATLPNVAAEQVAQPTFHLAPVLLNPPDDVDTIDNTASARMNPRTQAVPVEFEGLPTRGLTVQALQSIRQARVLSAQDATADASATPKAAGGVVATYSPAQIRAAYGLPALPSAGVTLTSTQAAQLGAGQTIYLIDAMTDPNIASELAAFNQKFGLPTCSTQTIAANATLPLAAASTDGCVFSIVTSTANGAMTSNQPAYDSGWATEIALDVEWSHATAPLARIILINTPDASTNSFLGAIRLANSMGAGSVSMSFGSTEGSWTASADSVFNGANMTYLASVGDSGASVQWPAVSPNVLAVGGTTLTYSGAGTRSEVTWSDTGGGISLYTSTPSYQSNAVPGLGTVGHRSVSDVAFNADPSTGQYVAILAPGSSTVSWGSVGGTSLGTPQWAGIIAVANASRALSGKPGLGDPHAILYGQIAAVPGSYASVFADITKGSDGGCSTCSARVGYDQVTGLGTPNVAGLLSVLSGIAVAPTAPVVTSAGISGQVGTALSFTVSVADANPLTYTLSGAPSGMSIASSGAVTWPAPVAGTYSVTVTARDASTGLSGQGVYTIIIAAQAAPMVASASIGGKAGTALSFHVSVTDSNPLTYTLSGAPSGMSIGSSGTVTWAIPVVGTYSVTVTAKDAKTGLSGQGVLTVKITAATAGPAITAPAMTGVAGKPITGTVSISDPGASALAISISGVPMGMMFSVNGLTLTANWANPLAGNYTMKISVTDSAGLSTQTTIPVTITAR
jgi:subtilase family serine protease